MPRNKHRPKCGSQHITAKAAGASGTQAKSRYGANKEGICCTEMLRPHARHMQAPCNMNMMASVMVCARTANKVDLVDLVATINR